MQYVSQEKKTLGENGMRYLTGINCIAELAYPTFMATKNLYRKADGTFFYQYVQSFSPEENVTPKEAHAIALELAEKFFPDCEVLVATHIDTEHLHSHFVINSVMPDTGQKVHFTPKTLVQMREVSDQICAAHGLTLLKPYQQKRQTKGLKAGEYRAAVRGESWKFQLITTVESVMKRVCSREEFIREMCKRGYEVRWEDSRKSIVYTTPGGMKCRDDKLHELKFRKENMEYEFRIRQRTAQQFAGQAEAESILRADPDGSAGEYSLHHAGANSRPSGERAAWDFDATGEDTVHNDVACDEREFAAACDSGGHGTMAGDDAGGKPEYDSICEAGAQSDERTAETGWERERILFTEALQCGSDVPMEWGKDAQGIPPEYPMDDFGFGRGIDGGQPPTVGATEIVGEVVHLLARLEESQDTQIVDSTTRPVPTHRKRKKHGLGQREDDHEWEQKME